MLQKQAMTEWKTKEQLSYNLNSEFMDYEDKWKQALGQDLYKERANSLAVDPSMRQRIIQLTTESNITREESLNIQKLLFKDGKGHLHDSWKQGFFFDEELKYGIFQD